MQTHHHFHRFCVVIWIFYFWICVLSHFDILTEYICVCHSTFWKATKHNTRKIKSFSYFSESAIVIVFLIKINEQEYLYDGANVDRCHSFHMWWIRLQFFVSEFQFVCIFCTHRTQKPMKMRPIDHESIRKVGKIKRNTMIVVLSSRCTS